METSAGLRPIEKIASGETVWARCAKTGEWRLAPVVEAIRTAYRVLAPLKKSLDERDPSVAAR